MALCPSVITVQSLVENTKGSKSFVSTVYFAKFTDGSVKTLCRKYWMQTNLLKPSDFEEISLDQYECRLYYCDWSKNPSCGTWEANCPPSLIPLEIFS